MEKNCLVKLVFIEEGISSAFLFESKDDKLLLSTDFGESIAPCIDMTHEEGFSNEEFDYNFIGKSFMAMIEELTEYTSQDSYYSKPYFVTFNDASAGILYDHITIQMIINPKSGTIYCDFDTGTIRGDDGVIEYDIPTTGTGVMNTNYKCIVENLLESTL